MRLILITGLAFSVAATGLSAQDMTDDELLNTLERQRDALQDNTLGLTRGLSIVTGGASAEGSEAEVGENGLTNLGDIKPGAVVRFEDDLEINIRINFEFDSATLKASEQPALEQMCRVMKKADQIEKFRIIGHTDSSGSDVYNKRLSQLRAEEVGRHMINNCGITPSRLEMVGYGEEFPDNTSDPRAPENRRVEFQALS